MLNNDQLEAVNHLNNFIKDDKMREFTLTGSAGTGKSYTINEFIDKNKVSCIMLAPTHKARKVLADFANNNQYVCKVSTLHSFFSIVPMFNKKGQYFGLPHKKGSNRNPALKVIDKMQNEMKSNYVPPHVKLIIIDECSMVRDNEYKIIRHITKLLNVKVLWVGDKLQLPPVQSKSKYPHSYPLQKFDGWYELTTPVRNTGEIYEYCQMVRCALSAGNTTPPDYSKFEKRSMTKRALLSIEKQEDSIILAFRNAKVKEYNNIVRQHLWGDEASEHPILPEETIMFNAPYSIPIHRISNKALITEWHEKNNEKYISFVANSDTKSVKDIDYTTTFLPYPPEDYKSNNYTNYCMCDMFSILNMSEITNTTFDWTILHINNEEIWTINEHHYKKWEDTINTIAKAIKKSRSDKRLLWEMFYIMKECNAKIQHLYSLTVDKSQGSTYDNVFIDGKDVLSSKSLKRWYVAVSRAKKSLTIG